MVQFKIDNWSIVLRDEIFDNTETPQKVYARLDCGKTVALFGKAKDDPRHDPSTGAFKDGNRIVTSPITKTANGIIYTEDSVYNPGIISDEYLKWCEQNEYSVFDSISMEQEIAVLPYNDKQAPNKLLLAFMDSDNYEHTVLRHICENCGKDELLTIEEAFRQGWDYPPKMGSMGVVSPRTCGECAIDTTLWWALACEKIPPEELGEKHRRTLQRILNEPSSILP